MIEALNPSGVTYPFGAFSNAVLAPPGRLLFISGQAATDADGQLVGVGDITAQTRQVLTNIQAILKSVGAGLEHVLSVSVFVTDMKHLDAIHAVRREFFRPPFPASTLVQVVSLVDARMLIEINAVAAVPTT